MSSWKNIVLEIQDGGVRIVKVSRPKALNALNAETLKEMRSLLTELAASPDVRAVILTGDGEKAFIAGADISEMKSLTPSQGVEFAKLGHEVAKLLENMPKPVIAAVNGFALGGGTEMAIACDFILASERAVFGQPEVCLGIIPGFGGNFRLSKYVGVPMAKELIFSGRKIPADEALRIGLANQVVPAGELMKTAVELAQQIGANSLAAVAKAKALLNEFSESVGTDYKLDTEIQSFSGIFGSKDQVEGMGAFLEKRKPVFEGQ